jgi:O-antigen/teichoic acid export membrane protein
MRSLHRPFLFSAIDKYLGLIINLATTVVVARLLSPDEIGVFVVGSAVALLAETLKDFGTSAYVIQQRDNDPAGLRTAFTATMALSLVLAVVLFLLARPIADFYSDARLTPVVQVAAGALSLNALASVPGAMLRREMAFGPLAVINTTGLLVNIVASVGFIWLGYGYLSLAFASFSATLANVAGTILYHRQFWIYRPSLARWRDVGSFGGFASATSLLNNFCAVLPQALLGRFVGFDAAGLYTRAMTLCQLPDRAILGALQPVIFPAFAAEAREGDLTAAYVKTLALLSAVQWPVLVCLAVMAEPVVHVVLGPQWKDAAPVLRVLAFAYMATMPAPLTYPTLVALGRVKDTLTSSLISLPLGIVAIAVAAPFGVMAMAVSLLLSWPLQTVVAMVFIRRAACLAWGDIGLALWKSIPVSAIAALAPLMIAYANGFRPDLPLPALAAAVLGATAGWLLGLMLTRHPLLAEILHARDLIRGRLPGQPTALDAMRRNRIGA